MRINDAFAASTSAGRTDKTQTSGAEGASSSAVNGSAQDDLVSLSSASDLTGRALSSTSADRTAHIQNVTAQVRSGSYGLDAHAISKAIVGDMSK